MLIGYARVSKADGSQTVDLQLDELIAAGVNKKQVYVDYASGKKDDRPGLEACLKAVRKGDTLLVWKLDRLGRNLTHLVNLIDELHKQGVALKVLKGQGASIDTTTAAGKLVFGIFAVLAVLIIVIAAFNIVIAQGDPSKVAKQRGAIIYALVGLVLAISAEILVTAVLGRF